MEKDLIENGIKAKERLEKKSKGPLLLSNPYGKVRSRYLNEPTSSCHDLCKYGHRHERDDERNHAVFRRFMTNNILSDAEQNHARGLNGSGGRKSSGLKLKASDKGKALQQSKQQEGKEVGASEIIGELSIEVPSEDHAMAPQLLLLEKRRIQFPHQTILQDSSVEVDQIRSLSSNKKKKKKQATMKPNASSPLLEPSHPGMQNKHKASIEVTSGDGPNILEEKAASYMRETITSSASKVDGQKKMTAGKLSGSSKSQREEKNASVLVRKTDGSAKPAVSLKARTLWLRPVAQWNGARNPEGSTNIRKITKEKPKNEGMIIKDKNFGKEGDGDASESCVSELSEIEDVNGKQSCELSEGGKRRARRTAAVKLHDSSSLPYKMKFKRGRVIDPRPKENVSPKRLKFRRGRVLDEKSNGEVTKRIIRKKEKGDMKAPGSAAHGNSSEATAVMLKHQDAQEKRNLRALFNHVIEETANKLVQTRKSKVKALVGAFETVISLQETKAAHLV